MKTLGILIGAALVLATAAHDARATKWEPSPAAVPVLEPKCMEDTARTASCWKRISGEKECWLFQNWHVPGQTITWSGSCSGGVPTGKGKLVWQGGHDKYVDTDKTGTGPIVHGKLHGRWIVNIRPNVRIGSRISSVWEGSYVDGKRHGRWVRRDSTGYSVEAIYDNGNLRHSVGRRSDGSCAVRSEFSGERPNKLIKEVEGPGC